MLINEQRKKFVELTKKQLTGSDLKDNLLIDQKPLDRFFTGFLFPIIDSKDGLDGGVDAEENTESSSDDNKKEATPVKKVKKYMPPSSAGFSFFITGDNIRLRIFYNAAQYHLENERDELNQKFTKQNWKKNYLADDGKEVEFSPDGVKHYKIFDDKAKIDALWRPYNNGYIVTITMSNSAKIDASNNGRVFNLEQNSNTLFEVEFKCIVESGDIDLYPSKNKALLSEDFFYF